MSQKTQRLVERRKLEDHWMIGQRARAFDAVGTVREIVQHDIDVDGEAETHTRVVLECDDSNFAGGSLLIDVNSKAVEVLENL